MELLVILIIGYVCLSFNSSQLLDGVDMLLNNLQLSKYFHFVITSEDTGYEKPDPRMFQKAEIAFSKLQFDQTCLPQQLLHVGDDYQK